MTTETGAIRSFLDQLLGEGRELAQKGEDIAADRLGYGDNPDDRRQLRQTALAGGAAAGLLGLLAGTGRGRRVLGQGVLAGGLGLMGKLAYDSFFKGDQAVDAIDDSLPIDRSPDERRARLMVAAMIAAAKSDGHIDDREREAIAAQLSNLPKAVQAAMNADLLAESDPLAIAAQAVGEQERREIFVASAMMASGKTVAEETYLSELAAALGLSARVVTAIRSGVTATMPPTLTE